MGEILLHIWTGKYVKKAGLSILVFLILLFLIPEFSSAQDLNYTYQYYSTDDGLSHRIVRHSLIDIDGMLWISTEDGLNRFDGHKFYRFSEEDHGLSSNAIRKVCQDQNAWLWVFSANPGKETGWDYIDLFHPDSQVVKKVTEVYPALPKSQIISFVQNASGNICLEMVDGDWWILETDSNWEKAFQNIKSDFSLTTFDDEGNYYGIIQKRAQDLLVKSAIDGSLVLKHKIEPGILIENIGFDLNGNLVLGLFNIDGPDSLLFLGNNTQKMYPLSDNPYGNMLDPFISNRISLKIHFGDPYMTFSMNDSLRLRFRSGYEFSIKPEELSHENAIKHIHIDDNNNIWLSTLTGLFKIEPVKKRFRNFLSTDKSIFPDNAKIECRGIMGLDDGSLLVNSYTGFYHLDEHGKILKNSVIQRKLKDILRQDRPEFKTIYQSSNGNIWLGWYVPLVFDVKTKQWERLEHAEKDLLDEEFKDLSIWTIYEASDKTMWFGTLHGHLFYMDPVARQLKLLTTAYGKDGLNGASIYQCFDDSKGNTWLVTNLGLFEFDPLNKKLGNRYWKGGAEEFFIPGNNLHHVFEDEAGYFWIATGGNGLIRKNMYHTNAIDQKSDVVSYTIKEGLSSNTLYAVYPGKSDDFWVSSDNGIIHFDKNTGKSRAYLESDGIPHHEFNRISHHRTSEGFIYFGGLNGLVGFDPVDIEQEKWTENAPLVLSDFKLFDGEIDSMVNKLVEYQSGEKIVLQANDKLLDFEFALLNYKDTDLTRYYFTFDRNEAEWQMLSSNQLFLSGLGYGEHLLSVKAQASNGLFSANNLEIPIIRLKPFYLQSWFLIFIFMSIAGAIFFYFRMRNARLHKQKLLLQNEVDRQTGVIRKQNIQLKDKAEDLSRMDKVKSRFFANVSHELRTPLTLMLGITNSVLKHEKLGGREKDMLERSAESGFKMEKMINELLDLTKLESGKLSLNEKPVALHATLKRIIASFDSLAISKNIELTLRYLGNTKIFVALDEEKFEKIVLNYINNALKFTGSGGNITLRFDDLGESLRIQVNDTGRGIHQEDIPHVFERFYQTNQAEAPAEGGTGIGLAIVREFAGLMKGRVWVESRLEKGSTFYFEWPKKLVENDNSIIAGELQEKKVLLDESKKDNVKQQTSQVLPQKQSGFKVLIVEDNPDMQEYLKYVLEEKYNLIFAANGAEGLEKVEELPDLIISDVMMPVMDGFQFLAEIKNHERFWSIPVIMLTARAANQDKLKALRIGVDDYLLKPFREEELLVRMNNLLRRLNSLQSSNEESIIETNTTLKEGQQQWLETLEILVNKEIGNDLLSTEWLAGKVHLSVRQFQRRLKILTGLTPTRYVREVKLDTARRVLESGDKNNLTDVAKVVGYKDPQYFARIYKVRYGKSPTDYFV